MGIGYNYSFLAINDRQGRLYASRYSKGGKVRTLSSLKENRVSALGTVWSGQKNVLTVASTAIDKKFPRTLVNFLKLGEK